MCFTQKKNPALKLHVITLDYRTYALSKQHFRQHAYVSRILRSSGPQKKNEEGITQKHSTESKLFNPIESGPHTGGNDQMNKADEVQVKHKSKITGR